MIKSRLDLYRPTDDIIEEDPAYQGYNIDDLREDAKKLGKMLYGQPGGLPDLADLVQGTARIIEPIQKAITPEDPKNLIGVDLEKAMAQKARERIAPQVEGTGRFAEQEIARRVEEDIGGREFSPFKAGLQRVLEPELETVQEVAAGKPLYELSPIQLTDFIFAGANVLDVAGVTSLLGKLSARGVSAGARALANSLQGLNKQQATQVLARANPRFVREIQESIVDGGRTTERLTDQDLATAQMQAAEERSMRFLTGKPPKDKKGTLPPVKKGETREAVEVAPGIIKPGTKGGQNKQYIDFRNSETQRLIDILKARAKNPEDKNLTMQQIIEKYDIKEQMTLGGKDRGQLKLKVAPREMMAKQIPKIYQDMQKFAKVRGGFSRSEPNNLAIKNALEEIEDKSYPSVNALSHAIGKQIDLHPDLVRNRYTKKGRDQKEFKKLFNQKVKKPPKKDPAKDRFLNEYNKVGAQKFRELFNLDNVNPDRQQDIIKLASDLGLRREYKASDLFEQFAYDKYRSIKETTVGDKLFKDEKEFVEYLAGDFPDRQLESLKDLGPTTRQDLLDEFDKYLDTEFERLYMQSKGMPFLEELFENPKYKPYLVDKNGMLDFIISTANKTHDIPMFVTRTAGKERLKKTGRMVNTGTEPEFLTPHFQLYNRLQVILDPMLQKIADVEMSKTLRDQLANMPVTLAKDINRKGGLKRKDLPRTNFIGEGYLKVLRDRGYIVDPKKSKNQLEFILDVAAAVDRMYKDYDIRTVVPVLDSQRRKTSVEFGLSQEDKLSLPLDQKVENHNKRLKQLLDYAIENNIPPEKLRSKGKEGGFLKLNKGGAVRMAIGGDPLQNINQQQFAPDPAFQGQDFFQEAVDSGNLTAFNPLRLFNTFGKVKGTPTKTDVGVTAVSETDFPFKSFTYEKLQSPNAPGAAKPQDWANYLTGGDTAPIAEIRDSGLEQFLRDYEKYYPGRKLSKQQIVDYFETSPTGNLEMRVKQQANPDFPDQGRPRHENAGQQPLDDQGVNYREVVVQAGPIPGEGQPFVNSSHFSEPNVIAFTRVADYNLADGSVASVIQELQTDMLNTVRVEQLRIKTLLDRLKLTDQKARDVLNNPASTPDQIQKAQRTIDALAQQVSPEQRALLEQTQGIKPFPNAAGASLIPGYTDEILKLQDNVNELLAQKKAANQPFIDENIFEINQRQLQLRDQLLDLNRSLEIDQNLKNIKVPNADQADELRSLSQRPIENFSYERTNDIQLFPPVPFTKTADYVDLIIKATIKDAQSRGINRVGIYTGELVNQRWGKDPTGPAGKKFNDLYSKVSVQQMNNIAKKYGGEVIEGAIVDPTKATRGLRFFNRDVDGGLTLNKEDVARRTTTESEEGLDEFYNEQMRRFVSGGGYRDKDVVLSREVAPGQFQDFYVRADDESIDFVPLGEGETINDALVVIEEFNPSLVKIPVLVLEEAEKAKRPFFLYRKKDGGKIASDGLVSITDIYGDY